ncbi:MAG: ABC transporter ATP-binding protein, partial [Lachnospiraceae bacterium]|nr:ABC transporter ATP-binding protein [Lachnospiraceae bacterium]
LDADRRKHQKEVEKTENEIALLEDKKSKLTDQMNNPDIASNSAKLNELAKEIEDIDNSLSVLMEKWESLLD